MYEAGMHSASDSVQPTGELHLEGTIRKWMTWK